MCLSLVHGWVACSKVPAASLLSARCDRGVGRSDRLKPRCLHELDQAGTFDQTEKRSYAILKGEQEALEQKMAALQERLDHSAWGPAASWWKSTVSEFLQTEFTEEWLELKDDPVDAEGTRWNLWCTGKSKAKGDKASEGIWALDKQARMKLRDEWNQEVRRIRARARTGWTVRGRCRTAHRCSATHHCLAYPRSGDRRTERS